MSPAREPVIHVPLAPGTAVVKCNSLPEHVIKDGTIGRIVTAIGPALPESEAPGTYAYWVRWDNLLMPVVVSGTRIRPV